MIGGQDLIIPVPPECMNVLDSCARAILRRWPCAVFQDGASGARYTSYASAPFHGLSELIAYRDARAADSWEALGAHDSNRDSMLYLVHHDGELTIVVDDLFSDRTRPIVEAIACLLRMDIFNLRAERQRHAA